MRGSKTLEVNPRHALVRELRARHAADPDAAATKDLASAIFDVALLESGFPLDDAKGFAARVHALLGGAYAPGSDLGVLADVELPAEGTPPAPKKGEQKGSAAGDDGAAAKDEL